VTTTSRLAVFIDATIATLTAALPATRPVYDGPVIVPGDVRDWCIVGGAGHLDDEPRAGGFDQTWAGLGARARDEGVDIQCALVSWSGDEGPFKTVRDAVVNDLALIETQLLASITQGMTGVLWTQLVSGELFQSNTNMGPRARLPFIIHARSRI
jgi:hypothetical protein